MITTANIANSRKFPGFIKNHEIFKTKQKIEKVFPKIGLLNETITSRSNRAMFAPILIESIHGEVQESFPDSKDYDKYKALTVKDVSSAKDGFRIPEDLYDLLDHHGARCDAIVDLAENLNEFELVFSAGGMTGAWDIATMSERGISSCQSWDDEDEEEEYVDEDEEDEEEEYVDEDEEDEEEEEAGGGYRKNLIGSVVDPYLGIIYLTDGSEAERRDGKSMLVRSLVRYVFNKKTKKPALYLEKAYYSNDLENYNLDVSAHIVKETKLLFKRYLESKSRLQVIMSRKQSTVRELLIPGSPIVSSLKKWKYSCSKGGFCQSYRDSGLEYSKSFNNHLRKVPKLKK